MKNRLVKLIPLLLSLLICIPLLAACGNTGNGGTSSGSATTVPVSTEEDTSYLYDDNGYLKDEIPDELDYNKEKFVIFTWNNQTTWEWTDLEQSGDVIKDALLTRQIRTEERLGVELVIESQPGEWGNRNAFIDAVYNNNASGTDVYDLIGQYTPAASIGAMRGCYTDLNDVEYLDLSKPWWPADITESSQIAGKLYFTTGDVTATLIRNIGAVLCNLKLAESHNLDDVYTIVKNQEWTMDKFMEMTIGTIQGLNPDGSPSYSLTMNDAVTFDNLFYGAGFRYIDTSTDGNLVVSPRLSTNLMSDWFETCNKLLYDNADVSLLGINGTNGFAAGNVLFHFGSIADVQNFLREVDFDFAILPYPKINADQDDYCTLAGYWVTMYSIPANASDKSMSGAVLEILGSLGYRTVTPAVYKDAFQYRILVSQSNAEMFDTLHETLVFDTGRTFADAVGCFAAFREAAKTGSSWSSYYQMQSRVWTANIQKIITALG